MNIGIDIRILSAGVSGIPIYTRNILDNLQNIDKKNSYYLFGTKDVNYKIENNLWRIINIKLPPPSIFSMHLVYPLLLKKYKIDLFISFDFICPLLFAKHTKRITIVYDLTFLHFPKTLHWKRLVGAKLLTPLSIKKSEITITISDFIRRDILKSFQFVDPSRLFIMSPASPDWILPAGYNCQQRGNHLLFVGSFEPRKNILSLIKALEILKRENIRIPLHIVGPKGWNNQAILDYIQKSTVLEDIVWRGFLSKSELIDAYCNCKAFIFPSIYEGFGIPILEALKMDCLVLTSKASVMEEIAKDHAIYFDPNNPADIAQKIKEIFQSDFDRDKYLKNSNEVTSQYTWAKSAQLFHGLLEKL